MSGVEDPNKSVKIQQERNKTIKWIVICLAFILIITIAYTAITKNGSGTQIEFGTFKEQLWAGNIEEIKLNQTKIQIYYKSGEAHWLHRRDSIEREVVEEWNALSDALASEGSGNLPPRLVPGTTTVVSVLDILYPILLVGSLILSLVLIIRSVRSTNNKNFDFVKSRARITPSKTKFSDVAGADEEKRELEDVVDFLKNPKKYTELGAKIPKGVILVGPPGTGKTLLARAVAGEADVPFFTISGSDFMELFVGVGASRVRDLFENAKKAKPCIIFIDEIDAVGRQRGAGLGGGNDEREQTLNQLLVQMDGFEENEGVIVMAATNRVDILDPALLRPGRFDRRINIGIPDIKGREEILKVHARNKKFIKSIDFKTIARITAGFTGAELENLLNEAAIMVAKENRKFINENDIQQAIMKVSLGPQKRSRVIDEKDKFDTAIHESGHALISRLAKEKSPVHEVSIIPRGGAGGYTLSTDDDSTVYFRDKLFCKIQMLLGGITAEKLYVGDISTGASNDLKRATSIARRMVTEWGMSSEIGMVYLGSDDEIFVGKSYQERMPYSENQGKIIDEEVKKIIDSCQKVTEKILTDNKDILMTMANVLLERETIYAEEVDMILAGKSKEEVVAYIDNKDKKPTDKAAEPAAPASEDYVDKLIKDAENREKSIKNNNIENNGDGEKPEEKPEEDMLDMGTEEERAEAAKAAAGETNEGSAGETEAEAKTEVENKTDAEDKAENASEVKDEQEAEKISENAPETKVETVAEKETEVKTENVAEIETKAKAETEAANESETAVAAEKEPAETAGETGENAEAEAREETEANAEASAETEEGEATEKAEDKTEAAESDGDNQKAETEKGEKVLTGEPEKNAGSGSGSGKGNGKNESSPRNKNGNKPNK